MEALALLFLIHSILVCVLMAIKESIAPLVRFFLILNLVSSEVYIKIIIINKTLVAAIHHHALTVEPVTLRLI